MNLKYHCKREHVGDVFVKRAIVPVFLVGANSKKFQFTAVLDSGSDFVLIPREVADILALKYNEKEIDEAITFDGSKIVTTQSKLQVILEKDREQQSFNCNCAILLNKDFDHEDLIFGSSFFENFKITFDYPQGKFSIKSTLINLKIN